VSFKPYSDYRARTNRYLPSVPSHWEATRFKLFTEEREERSTDGNELLLSVSEYSGVSPRSTIIDEGDHLSRAESLEGYKVCHPGDLVMNIMLAWKKAQGISYYHGIVSPAYSVYALRGKANPRFIHYLARTQIYADYFKSFSSGVIDSRLRLYPDTFLGLKTDLPPEDEQSSIANFLDRETAKIDALIAEQQGLIELLQEKRQAVISHAVTKGLNPNAPIKDSGVEWLGEVPEHWELSRVKTISSFTTSGPRGWSEQISEDGALFVQSGDLNDSLGVDFEDCKRVRVSGDAEASRTRLQAGDAVVCITGAKTGNAAVCHELPEDSYINQHLCLIRPLKNIDPCFLGLLLKSHCGQTHFALAQYGLKQGLSLENVRETPVVLPPMQEQVEIVSYVNKVRVFMRSLINESHHSIEVLKERHSALISAAVTGQIDVRGLVEGEGSEQ
jgi:type I restriction enzyme, S subunit